MLVLWTAGARADLLDIIREIAHDRSDTARRVAQTTRSCTHELSDHPQLGRVVEEFGNEQIRERVVRPWQVIYRVLPDCVHVLAILHGRRVLSPRSIGLEEES